MLATLIALPALIGVVQGNESVGAPSAPGIDFVLAPGEVLEPALEARLRGLHAASIQLSEDWLDSASEIVRSKSEASRAPLANLEVAIGSSAWIEARLGSRMSDLDFSLSEVHGFVLSGSPPKMFFVQDQLVADSAGGARTRLVDARSAAHEFAHLVLWHAAPNSRELPPQVVEGLTDLLAIALLRRAGMDEAARAFVRDIESFVHRYDLGDVDGSVGPEREFRCSRHARRLAALAVTTEPVLAGRQAQTRPLVAFVLQSLLDYGNGTAQRELTERAEPGLLGLLENLLEITRGPDPTITSCQRFAAAIEARLDAEGAPRYHGDGVLIATAAGDQVLLSALNIALLSPHSASLLFEHTPFQSSSERSSRIAVAWSDGAPALLFRRSSGASQDELLMFVTRTAGPVLRAVRWLGPLETKLTLTELEPSRELLQVPWRSLELRLLGGTVVEVLLDGEAFGLEALVPGARLIGLGIDGPGYVTLHRLD